MMNIIPIPQIQMSDQEEKSLHINEEFKRLNVIITLKKNPGKHATLCVEYNGNKGELINPSVGYYNIENDDSVSKVVICIAAIGPDHSRLTIGREQ